MIKYLKINDYRGLNCEINFENLSQLVFIAGQNGSGKSNLLAAISKIIYFIEFYLIKGTVVKIEFKFEIVLMLDNKNYRITDKDGSEVSKLQISDLPEVFILYNGNYNPHKQIAEKSRKLKLDTSQNIRKFNLIHFDDFKYILFTFWLYDRNIEYNKGFRNFLKIKKIKLIGLTQKLLIDINEDLIAFIRQKAHLIPNSKPLIIGEPELSANYFISEKDFIKLLKSKSEITDFKIEIELESGIKIGMNDLSEGQKQYITLLGYSEIFNYKNTIFLLDEPDNSFNPLLQKYTFENLSDNIHEISQIICCTHSIGTLSTTLDNKISTLNANDNFSIIDGVSFKDFDTVIKDFTKILENTKKLILLVEGKTDKTILENAWDKLYPNCDKPFFIPSFSDGHNAHKIKIGLEDATCYQRDIVIGLFDFDFEGYNKLNGLKKDDWEEEIDFQKYKCPSKKNKLYAFYGLLLPVPDHRKNYATKDFKSESILSIELLFRNKILENNIKEKDIPGTRGTRKIFIDGNKKKFSESTKNFTAKDFEQFKPIFETIQKIIEENNSLS